MTFEREPLRYPESLPPPKSVIVIGGRIAGVVSSYILAKNGVDVLCLDSYDILREGRPPCTGCGGLIQSRTTKLLSKIDIDLPERVIRRRLDGFVTHLPGSGELLVPTQGLLAVYRGFGPLEGRRNQEGFDSFLLRKAVRLAPSLKSLLLRQ